MTLQDAQQEAYYAYDPASGIPEEQFTMEFIKSRYPQLINPQPLAQAPTIRPSLKPTNMLQGALAPQEQQEPVVSNRLQGVLSDNYVGEVPKKKSVKDKLKRAILSPGWNIKDSSLISPSGFSIGKKGLGYKTKF